MVPVSATHFKAEFRLRNTGTAALKNVLISIRLPEGVTAEPPKPPPPRVNTHLGAIDVTGLDFPDFYGMTESREDFFEPGGRVGVVRPLAPINGILLPEHADTFEGLGFPISDFPFGSDTTLEYRIDAEEMTPSINTVTKQVPPSADEWVGELDPQ